MFRSGQHRSEMPTSGARADRFFELPERTGHSQALKLKVGGGSVNFRRVAKTRSRAPTPVAIETFRGVTSILTETIRSTRTGHTDTDRPYSQKNVTAVQAPDETRLDPSCWAGRGRGQRRWAAVDRVIVGRRAGEMGASPEGQETMPKTMAGPLLFAWCVASRGGSGQRADLRRSSVEFCWRDI